MKRPWIKVCGLTREEDVQAAVEAGVDAVGFILAPESPRRIDVERAARLAERVPPGVARVGVTVSLPPETVRRLVESIGLTALQAHGEESPELCAAYPVPVVKALRTGPGFSLDDLAPYRRWPVLLDGFDPGARGGTGRRADWSVAVEARRAGYRVLLAGGLGPDTVREAVERVQPVAVDLNSAVETEPGIKDAARIRDALARLSDLDPPGKETWPW